MSNTHVAGAKLIAANQVPQKIWTMSSTSAATAITTTEAIISTVGTSPSTTYEAGWAYELVIRLRAIAIAGAQDAWVTIRDTTAAGTQRMSPVYVPRLPAVGLPQGFYHRHWVANTGGSDITGRVLVLCGDTSTNSWTPDADASHPAVFACYKIGKATDFPEAVAL